MLKTLWWYCSRSVFCRLGSVVFCSQFLLALAVAASSVWLGAKGALALDSKISELADAILSYASISFGFCLTGLALSLTLPDREFVQEIANMKMKNRKTNGYSDLIFVFSWSSIAQLALIAASLILLIVAPEGALLIPDPRSSWLHIAGSGLLLFLSFYAVAQFLVTVITLSQVGEVYIEHLKRRGP